MRNLMIPAGSGLIATLALVGFYAAILSVAQGWGHALEFFETDWPFVSAISLGFGIQIGLLVYVRSVLLNRRQSGVSVALTGTGTGTSTVTMLACCAHHLSDVLPIIGLSGAAIFLAEYRVPFMLFGITANIVGILVMLRLVRRLKKEVRGNPVD